MKIENDGKCCANEKGGSKRFSSERGFTLLEYCAGATIIAVTVYGALTVLGENFQTYLDSLGGWLVERGSSLQSSSQTQQ